MSNMEVDSFVQLFIGKIVRKRRFRSCRLAKVRLGWKRVWSGPLEGPSSLEGIQWIVSSGQRCFLRFPAPQRRKCRRASRAHRSRPATCAGSSTEWSKSALFQWEEHTVSVNNVVTFNRIAQRRFKTCFVHTASGLFSCSAANLERLGPKSSLRCNSLKFVSTVMKGMSHTHSLSTGTVTAHCQRPWHTPARKRCGVISGKRQNRLTKDASPHTWSKGQITVRLHSWLVGTYAIEIS